MNIIKALHSLYNFLHIKIFASSIEIQFYLFVNEKLLGGNVEYCTYHNHKNAHKLSFG